MKGREEKHQEKKKFLKVVVRGNWVLKNTYRFAHHKCIISQV